MTKIVNAAPVTPATDNAAELEARMRAAVLERLGARKSDTTTEIKQPIATTKKVEDPSEKIQHKLEACIKYANICVSDEEKQALQEFLVAEDVRQSAITSVLRLVASDDQLMQNGLSDNEKNFCANGISAIQRMDKKDKQILNICYPQMDNRLHAQAYLHTLKKAFADWVIHLKGLQLKGYRVNGNLPEDKEITSDREYLNKVLHKFMTSEVAMTIAEAIGNSPVYSEMYTTAVVYITNEEGAPVAKTLFKCDGPDHATAMGSAFRSEVVTDLLQGQVHIIDVGGTRAAVIDMNKPSLYLRKGKQGYRPNLYIPNEMMQEFLTVVPEASSDGTDSEADSN